MNTRYTADELKQNKIAINTQTEGEFNKLLDWAFEQGLTWDNGESLQERKTEDGMKFYLIEAENTCVSFEENGLIFCDRIYYEDEMKQKVISMDEFFI